MVNGHRPKHRFLKLRRTMKSIRSSLGLSFLVLLVGCTAVPKEQPQRTEVPVVISTRAQTVEPTKTAEILQPTPIKDLTPTFAANKFEIDTYCPEKIVGIKELPNLDGTLVFAADDQLTRDELWIPEPDTGSKLTFWNPQLNQVSFYDLPDGPEYYIYAESPDKEKLALTEGKTLHFSADLNIVDSNGHEYDRFSFPESWTFFGWLNNEQLLFRQYVNGEDLQDPTSTAVYDLVSINLSDHEQHILSSNFPNIFYRDIYWTWGSPLIYSPDTSLVLYDAYYFDSNKHTSILWNVKKNKVLSTINRVDWVRWSPDGSQLLLVTDLENDPFTRHDELYLINSTGEMMQVSFFREDYPDLLIDSPVWSPDNRYVAFWLLTNLPKNTGKLAVLDMETQKVDVFCQELNSRPFRFGDDIHLGPQLGQVNTTRPVWSPDSKSLLIEDWKDWQSSTLWVDLQNHTITKIADQARPVGWLK